jgi:hypothetical protein
MNPSKCQLRPLNSQGIFTLCCPLPFSKENLLKLTILKVLPDASPFANLLISDAPHYSSEIQEFE